MKLETYTYLLANPQNIDAHYLFELGELISKYPYFQSARAIQLKGLKNQNSFLYNDALRTTAAYTTDRDILFEYITSESFIQNEISQIILQHTQEVMDFPVISEDISEQVSVEINQQIKEELKKAEAILNPKLFERKVASVEKTIQNEENNDLLPIPEIKLDQEEKLELNKPLPFNKSDTHSFSEWLQLTSQKPIDRSKEEEKETLANLGSEVIQEEVSRKFELIEKFIQDRPKLKPSETPFESINLAAPFTQSNNSLMTETLAKVYLQQKNYKKAIQAYKILILKNPEKSGFFADQIRAIEKLNNPKLQ